MAKKLTLSRRVPSRTKTLVASWCKKDFMAMCQRFRDIRGRSRNPMDKCYWCGHAFEDGEMMALASFEKKGNKTLCQNCAEELLEAEPCESTKP